MLHTTRAKYLALGLLTATYVFAYADRFLMAILVQPIKADLGLSDAALGLLTGFAFAAFYAAAGIPLGRLADRVNRRTLLTVSLTAWSVATAACGVCTSFGQLALARMSVGIGEGGCAPASHSLISDLFPPAGRALALGIFTAGGMLGMLGGFAAGGLLEAKFGWRGAFWVLGGTGFLFAPVLALGLPEPRHSNESIRLPLTPLRELLATPGFLLLVIAYSFVTLELLGITQWLPAFYERSFGLGRAQIGGTLAIANGFGAIIGLIVGGWIADCGARRRPHWPMHQFVGSTILIVPLQLGLLLAGRPNVSFALAFLTMLVGMSGTGPALAAIQTAVPTGARATATATALVGSALIGMGGGPLMVGMLSDVLHSTLNSESLRVALVAVTVTGGSVAAILAWLATRKLHEPATSLRAPAHGART